MLVFYVESPDEIMTPLLFDLPADFAEGMGGALLNAGAMEIKDTAFLENMATDGGLAIENHESDMVLSNVTFRGNILSCPSQTYSYTQHVSTHRLPCEHSRQTFSRRKKTCYLFFTADIYNMGTCAVLAR